MVLFNASYGSLYMDPKGCYVACCYGNERKHKKQEQQNNNNNRKAGDAGRDLDDTVNNWGERMRSCSTKGSSPYADCTSLEEVAGGFGWGYT